jgi:type 1 fimbria pilin
MKLRHTLLATAVLAIAAPAANAANADLTVTGTIVPGSCTLTLANNGNVDLGVIDLTTLNQSAVTDLADKTVAVDIVCSAATKFATEATENRPGTSYTAGDQYFGLGETSNSEKIGYYQIGVGNATADSVAATAIASTNLTTWAIPGGGVKVQHGAGTKYTSVGTAATGPATVTEASWDLTITPTIAPRDELALTGPEGIDGNMTLTIVYL